MFSVTGDTLSAGQIPVTALVEKYGEPLYVYDLEVVERQARRLKASLPSCFEIFYSPKANPNISILAFLRPLIDGVEVASAGEWHAARRAGFSPSQMLLVGPAKSDAELREAVTGGALSVVAESVLEARRIDRIAQAHGATADILLRVNPGFDASGPKSVMGGAARQFGIDEEVFRRAWDEVRAFEHVRVRGIHAYVGTQIHDYKTALSNTAYTLKLGRDLQRELGLDCGLIDVGGGLGVSYFDGEPEFDLELFGAELKKFFADYGPTMPHTRCLLEVGRFMLAEAGLYVTRVRDVKKSRGQTFVLASGGINHNHTALAFDATMPAHSLIEVLNKMGAPKLCEAHICGPLCTPNDLLGRSVKVPEVEPGDLIGVFKSGAYGLTACVSSFLSHAQPAEVMVYKGRDFLIRQTSTVADLLRNQLLVAL